MITKALKNTMDFEKFLETKHLWDTFTDLQKFYIYENADYAASREDWE